VNKRELLIIIALASAGAADTLSLSSAQRLLFENNLDIQIAEMRHEKSTLEIVRSRAALFPTIDGYSSYGYQSEIARMKFQNRIPMQFELAPGVVKKDTMDLNIDQDIGDHDRVELGLNFNYPFSLGLTPIYDMRAKETGTAIQSLALQTIKNQLSLRLGQLYFQWELACRKVEAQSSLIDQLREYHLQMRNLFQAGVQPQSKVLEARARLEKANVDLLLSRTTVDSLLLELGDFLQLSDSTIVPTDYDLRLLAKSKDPAGVYVNPERSEMVALDKQVEQIDLYKKALFGRRIPTLFFNFGLRYGNPGVNMNLDEYMTWSVVGMQLRWTLYDGRENWAQRGLLQHDRTILGEERIRQEKQWEKLSAQAILQIRKARALQTATGASLEAANAFAHDLKNGLDAGVVISVDYLNALTAVTESRYALATAQTLEKMAFLQLMYARGEEIQF
jgi:outer membrane protein TolC